MFGGCCRLSPGIGVAAGTGVGMLLGTAPVPDCWGGVISARIGGVASAAGLQHCRCLSAEQTGWRLH